jgi:hypothetical protein
VRLQHGKSQKVWGGQTWWQRQSSETSSRPEADRQLRPASKWSGRFCEADVEPGFADDDVWRAAVFDAVVAQTDRAGHNWLAVPATGSPQLKLTDHGYCLGPDASPPSSTFYAYKEGEAIPDPVLDALQRLLKNLAHLDLHHLLPGDRLAGIPTRARSLVKSGRLQLP